MPDSYFDKLPKRVLRQRCQVLSADGNRCGNKAEYEVSAHLDGEIYEEPVTWVSFFICKEHYQSNVLFFGKPK